MFLLFVRRFCLSLGSLFYWSMGGQFLFECEEESRANINLLLLCIKVTPSSFLLFVYLPRVGSLIVFLG